MIPSRRVELGTAVTAELNLELPLHILPRQAECSTQTHTVQQGASEINLSSYRWSRAVWTIRCTLRTIRSGTTATGAMNVVLSSITGATYTLHAAVPQLTVLPIKNNDGGLEMAGRIQTGRGVSSGPYAYWIVAAVIAATAVALLFLSCRHRMFRQTKKCKRPPWIQASDALKALRDDILSHRIPTGDAFTRLTDILRGYLEERYRIPVSVKTTDEFSKTLKTADIRLPPEAKSRIYEFLRDADLVKFAKKRPDESQMLHAVDNIAQLVEQTIPAQGNDGETEPKETCLV